MNDIQADVEQSVEPQSSGARQTKVQAARVPVVGSARSIPQWVAFARLREPNLQPGTEVTSKASSTSMSLWFSSLPVSRWSLRLL